MSDDTGGGGDDLAALGTTLKAERVAAGLTQTQAARQARIARGTLLRWEQGEQPPRADLLERLRAVYAHPTPEGERGADVSDDTPDDMVPVSRETIGYLRGKLETTVQWLGSVEQQMGALGSSVHAVGETLTALRTTLDSATSGVAGLLHPGSFPGPNGNGTSEPGTRPATPLIPRDQRTRGRAGEEGTG